MRLATVFILVFFCSASIASVNIKPFQADSLQQILNERKAQPFIMLLWSIDCPPCLKELSELQLLRDQFPKAGLVLVSTDDQQHAVLVQQLLNEKQLDQLDNWIFSESMPERLRYVIDPNWYGELPRSYFYDKSHQRYAHSGSLNKPILEQWINSVYSKPDHAVSKQ